MAADNRPNGGTVAELQRHAAQHSNFLAGMVSGVVQAGLFNPYDRALYLSVRERRPFVHRANFRGNPYHGFNQAVLQRSISGGLYFVLQGWLEERLDAVISKDHLGHAVAVGLVAGTANGMILNQLATVKYHMWNAKEPVTFLQASRHMYTRGGVRPFFKGIAATGTRDMVFGVVYETVRTSLRLRLRQDGEVAGGGQALAFGSNVVAGLLATLLSGPFNYARNIQYATHPRHRPKSIARLILRLGENYAKLPTHTEGLSYLQQRLRIGFGSLRVAVGMALGQYLFEASRAALRGPSQ